MLESEALFEHDIVELKSKYSTISRLDVKNFLFQEEFVEQIQLQNQNIKHLIKEVHDFSNVYLKNPRQTVNNEYKYF